MYQEWFENYEKIINRKTNDEEETNYCPMCGRKLEK